MALGGRWRLGRFEASRRLMFGLLGSIHNLGLVGHIEDIAVAKDQQGKKLGLHIIQALDFIAEQVGCYKVRIPIPCTLCAGNLADETYFRRSSTAPKPMKASMSSAAIKELASKWRTTMRSSEKAR